VKIEKKIEKRGARVNRAQVKWGRRSINFDPDTVYRCVLIDLQKREIIQGTVFLYTS
jgi:hypothetical protein